MTHIDPLKALGWRLSSVQNPVRYLGGEYGQVVKGDSVSLTCALAFPDLYEIGMSNLAVKILYDGLNRLDDVRCERVFAPEGDFEALLAERSLPLCTLESGIPVREADIVAVSIGYECGITNLLTILSSGGVPIECAQRGSTDPIVIAGGCGITNPAPFSRFIDAFFIGEAEAGLLDLVSELARMKRLGASRRDLLERVESHPAVWTANKQSSSPGRIVARRAIQTDFGSDALDAGDRAVCLPVPSLRVVQDHGSVEIMRGCPNGCRFCHAGVYYRPQRMKSRERILRDVDYLTREGGYREISLMSLSSGDYMGISSLLDDLTARYSSSRVSFQLPSLKVNSFTLPLLERMAEVRKSGLTFAIETPVDAWQLSLNKEVSRDKILGILNEARKRGWNKAKFYFMVGLPVGGGTVTEEDEIISFMLEIQERTRMQCNVNVGTFIPKPHTPYQWARQLTQSEADAKLDHIRRSLPRGRFKVNTHKTFTSFLEGMMSRGDERVGEIILEAWKRGCRLDAWDDHAKPDVWASVIAEQAWDVAGETLRARDMGETLPWDGVSLGVSKAWLRKESERSSSFELTSRCEADCQEPCGVCGAATNAKPIVLDESAAVQTPPSLADGINGTTPELRQKAREEPTHRVVLSFSKLGSAAFIPHLSLLETWHKTFQRAALPVIFTEGFNPVPRFEIAQTLSLGISSDCDIASFLLDQPFEESEIIERLNAKLPSSIRVHSARIIPLDKEKKRDSLSTMFWGSEYQYDFHEAHLSDQVWANPEVSRFIAESEGLLANKDGSRWNVTVPFKADRAFRDLLAKAAGASHVFEVCSIHKTRTLAFRKERPAVGVDFLSLFPM